MVRESGTVSFIEIRILNGAWLLLTQRLNKGQRCKEIRVRPSGMEASIEREKHSLEIADLPKTAASRVAPGCAATTALQLSNAGMHVQARPTASFLSLTTMLTNILV